MNEYLSVDDLKLYLGISVTGDDTQLKRFCTKASRLFDTFCGRTFYPELATKYYDHPESAITLFVDDLLAVSTLTTNNGNYTISSDDYYLMQSDIYSETPYNKIVLKSDEEWFSYTGTPQQANAVTGTWGYHNDWSNAFVDSQDTVEDNPLSSSATTITVNNADGADKWGIVPRFKLQQLLKIESEYVYVTAVNFTSNTLTVVRGVNGTTAASHVQNTTISVYEPMFDIVAAMEVLATHMYRRKDSAGTETDRALTTASGIVILPSSLPNEVKDLLKRYRRLA